MRIGIFVGTRADLGPIEPVIEACARRDDLDVHVLCAVAWSAEDLRERLAAGIGFDGEIHQFADRIDLIDQVGMLRNGSAITLGAADLFSRIEFDALVVLGDRWELLYVVSAAFLAGIRIVHVHGGEVTEGAIDERVRHAVTKLADLHCAASADAAARIEQMGEPADRIIVTGAPGLDRLVAVDPMTDSELSALLGRPVDRPLALFTYHPPTAEKRVDLAAIAADVLAGTLAACEAVLVTEPGMDAGREEILAGIRSVAVRDPRVVVIPSLGAAYPRVLSAVDVVVGNSSSGVIEAATAGVPAVDVGDRQAGRLRAASVVHADEYVGDVARALSEALSPENRSLAQRAMNPYGDGHSADRIAAAIAGVRAYPMTKSFNETANR